MTQRVDALNITTWPADMFREPTKAQQPGYWPAYYLTLWDGTVTGVLAPTTTQCACCGCPCWETKCHACAERNCDPAGSYHCFTGHCDGSQCMYRGECEE